MNFLKLVFFALLTISISSCFSTKDLRKEKVFEGKYELPIKENKEKSISHLKNVLKELGYKSASNYELVFSKSNSSLGKLAGVSGDYTYTITVNPETNKIVLQIQQKGKSAATEQKTNKVFEEIKELYLK